MPLRNRRGFLSCILGSAWAGASLLERASLRAADARARSWQAPATLFDLEKVADGVYGAVARGRALINSNSVIFDTVDGLLIVDSQASPSAVAALVAQIRREIGAKPVRYVVVTHLHGDHTQGLAEHRRLAPDVRMISSSSTLERLQATGTTRLKSAVDGARQSLETFTGRASTAKTADERAYWQEMAAQTRAFIAETVNLQVELPDVKVDDRLVIHDPAGEIHVFFQGRGHTAGDLFVHCPQKRVIATGDMFHSFFPSMGDSYPGEWQATLREISKLPFDTAIGGHGGLQRAPVRLRSWRAYLDELCARVTRAREQGMPLERLVETVAPATLRSLRANRYGDFLLGQMRRYDFRIRMNTQAEVAARYVRENLTAVFRNLGRN